MVIVGEPLPEPIGVMTIDVPDDSECVLYFGADGSVVTEYFKVSKHFANPRRVVSRYRRKCHCVVTWVKSYSQAHFRKITNEERARASA